MLLSNQQNLTLRNITLREPLRSPQNLSDCSRLNSPGRWTARETEELVIRPCPIGIWMINLQWISRRRTNTCLAMDLITLWALLLALNAFIPVQSGEKQRYPLQKTVSCSWILVEIRTNWKGLKCLMRAVGPKHWNLHHTLRVGEPVPSTLRSMTTFSLEIQGIRLLKLGLWSPARKHQQYHHNKSLKMISQTSHMKRSARIVPWDVSVST